MYIFLQYSSIIYISFWLYFIYIYIPFTIVIYKSIWSISNLSLSSRSQTQRSPGFFGTPPPGAHGTPQGAAQTRLQWRSDPKREGNLPIVDGEIMAITGVITCYNWGYHETYSWGP